MRSLSGIIMDSQTVGNEKQIILNKLPFINKIKQNPKILLMIVAVILIAAICVTLLWLKDEPYAVLFSNLNDRDGGEVVSQLEKMNIPYQLTIGGSTILIPKDSVYETRLRLAQQGLPKGGAVGFELLDKERFGTSQFIEQINYQRALEGELARTISTINIIEEARVHLALPKHSLFVRERKFPSASIILTLLPGRALSQRQIDAIIHLTASGVPELQTDKVSIVDQNGNLLTDENLHNGVINAAQIEFVEHIENRVRQRIEKILTPVVGEENVTVQVSAEVDFSRQELTTETYDPNSDIAQQTMRSKQQIENHQSGQEIGIGGVPGALSNQPVPTSSAPIDDADDKQGLVNNNRQKPYSLQLNNTLNFEVNRQITHSQIPEGRIKRLTVAVLVNYKSVTTAIQSDQDGNAVNVTMTTELQRLDTDELNNIEALARQAMGFSQDRGDAITVANLKFSPLLSDSEPLPPFWQNSAFYELMQTIMKYAFLLFVGWLVWRNGLRPFWLSLQAQFFTNTNSNTNTTPKTNKTPPPIDEVRRDYKAYTKQQQKIFEDNMQQQQYIRHLVAKDPRVLALIIRGWLKKGDKDK